MKVKITIYNEKSFGVAVLAINVRSLSVLSLLVCYVGAKRECGGTGIQIFINSFLFHHVQSKKI